MKTIIIVLLTFLIVSCEDPFEFLDGPWVTNPDKNIVLHTCPKDFSSNRSPDSVDIKLILSDQYNFIDTINSRLKVKYVIQTKNYTWTIG
jgi:hypothetical protein